MRIYAKKLLSQESGYSGDKPDQRGKYVLVTQANLKFFPFLSTTTLNDSRVLNIILENGKNVGVNIVYHNAMFFPQTHSRAHNEVRIYRNSVLDADLNLDRGVIFVMFETDEPGFYKSFAVHPTDNLFKEWELLAQKIQTEGPKELEDINFKDSRLSNTSFSSTEELNNQDELIDDALKRLNKQRKQQPGLEGDPGRILEFVINSQQKYADWVRQVYGSRCAVRGVPLIDSETVGLDACHIMGHAEGGPLLPTNGILMSKDIHACFDQGFISLDEYNKVIISPTISATSSIHQFSGIEIQPIPEYTAFGPFSRYVEHHRKTRFISM